MPPSCQFELDQSQHFSTPPLPPPPPDHWNGPQEIEIILLLLPLLIGKYHKEIIKSI